MKIKAYHGSPNLFDKFDNKFIGNTTGYSHGKGFYFAETKETALAYTYKNGYLYEVELNIIKFLPEFQKTFSKVIISKILKEIIKQDAEALSNWVDIYSVSKEKAIATVADILVEGNTTAVEAIGDMVHSGMCDYEIIAKVIKSVTGYNAIVIDNKELNGKIYVMLDADDITIEKVDNVGGTSKEIL